MNTLRIIITMLCLLAVCRIIDMRAYAQNDEERSSQAMELEPELADYMAQLEVLTHKLGLAIDAENAKLSEFYHRESFYKAMDIVKLFPVYEGDSIAQLLSSTLLDSYYNIKDELDAEPMNFESLSIEYNSLLNRCNACHSTTNRAYLKLKRNRENPYLIDFATPIISEN